MNPYTENQQEKCPLQDSTAQSNQAIYFKMDLKDLTWVQCLDLYISYYLRLSDFYLFTFSYV